MKLNRSTKYKPNGEYWHEGRQVLLTRIFGGVAFHGRKKFSLVVGEEDFYGETHFYILCEAETGEDDSIIDIIDACRKMDATYRTQRWFGLLDKNVSEIIVIQNKLLYAHGLRAFTCMDVPRIGEWIDEQVGSIHMLVRPAAKRLHFFGESMVTAELKSLPSKEMRADAFPRATALSNVIYGLLRYSGEAAGESLTPDPDPGF